MSEFVRFARHRGIFVNDYVVFLPYFRNDALYYLGLEVVHEFTIREIAVMTWSARLFNYLLSIYSYNSHILLKYNTSHLSSKNRISSHVVACRYNYCDHTWEICDSYGPWYPIQPEASQAVNPRVFRWMKNVTNMSIHEFVPRQPIGRQFLEYQRLFSAVQNRGNS